MIIIGKEINYEIFALNLRIFHEVKMSMICFEINKITIKFMIVIVVLHCM